MDTYRPAAPGELAQRIGPPEGDAMCDMTPDARATFCKSLQSPGLARDFVHDNVCVRHGDRGAVALELLASELVTNAVLYGEPPISMSIRCSEYSLRLEVHHVNRPGQERVGSTAEGLGFLLVDKVAHEWGMTPTATGTTVWCTVRTGAVPERRHRSWDRHPTPRALATTAVEEAESGARRRPTKLGS